MTDKVSKRDMYLLLMVVGFAFYIAGKDTASSICFVGAIYYALRMEGIL